MNIAYPVSEILKCVETINQPEGKIYNNSDKTFNLNNTVSMKKKNNSNSRYVRRDNRNRGIDRRNI